MPTKKPAKTAPTRRASPARTAAAARAAAPAKAQAEPKAKRALPKAVQAVRARKSLPRPVGPAVVEEIFARFQRAMPEPKGEL